MNRIELESTLQNPHFIGCWTIEPLSICGDLIEFFEKNSELQIQGHMMGGVNLESKNSTDLSVRPRELIGPGNECIHAYLEELFACHRDYLEQWSFLKTAVPKVDIGTFNIQRYDPGGHFQKVHSERTILGTSHRLLAWMTYLNDVSDGGATRFIHQNLDIQPEKGKTLIWPAEWTHAHQGQVVNSGQKYVITGWMHFPQMDA